MELRLGIVNLLKNMFPLVGFKMELITCFFSFFSPPCWLVLKRSLSPTVVFSSSLLVLKANLSPTVFVVVPLLV